MDSGSRASSSERGVFDAAQLTSISAWSATVRCPGFKALSAEKG
jgi:hypothetical protein